MGIERLDGEGERSRFAESGFGWADMAFGPGRFLYTVRSVRAIFRFSEGSSQMTWVVIPDASVKLSAIAIDASGMVWTGGDNDHIYSIAPDKSVKMYAFSANIRDLALSDEYLYVLGVQNDLHIVWRFAINSDGELGSAEEFFNLTNYNGSLGLSLAVATSGQVYLGTNTTDPVVLVSP